MMSKSKKNQLGLNLCTVFLVMIIKLLSSYVQNLNIGKLWGLYYICVNYHLYNKVLNVNTSISFISCYFGIHVYKIFIRTSKY